ncbi:ribonuclease R [Cystobacter ferrugineus]|uniref:ribonuclease R n=1 Tax=Cystobacter ferrugineus TaxID=83449 RepID=UPI001FEC3637|nr:ribonuclease R [Cystobacter ferrugineus]
MKRHLAESKHPLGVKELLKLTQLHPGQQTQLKRTLRDMVRAGDLLKEGKRFRLRGSQPPSSGGDGSRGDGSRPPFRRERDEKSPGAWRAGPREERGAPGPGARTPSEIDSRFAPRGRFSKEGRPEPRGRFVREGRAEQPRSRFEDRGAEPRGRFARPERPGDTGRSAPQGRFARDDRRPGQGGRFDRDERRPGQGGRFDRDRRPPAEGRSFREERFVPRDRGERGGDGGRETLSVEGVLHVHRDGYGFVHPSSGQGDNIFLPPQEAARALDNDRVLVEAWGRPGRMEGRLVRVVGRLRQLVVGTYETRGRHSAQVLPSDKNLQMQGPIRVPPTQMARDGDLVKVRLGVGAGLLDPGEGLYGEVAGSLGKPGDPSAEVLSIAYSQGFSDEFPSEVMDEADRIHTVVSEEEARGEDRRDLRSLPLVTIDGEDARDFDDAVYAEDRSEGWRLVVAIADVTHYVREGTALNAEALRRATSVYLPDRVLPMLPERLSNGICSLRPDEDRLCMVADMVIDRKGLLVSSELYPAVMRSHARCTYNEVQDVLDGKDVPHRNAFKPHFERLQALARTLTQMRKERGAIDFNLSEHKVVMGEDGLPSRMEKRERKDSHRLIEECMLAANEAVAKFFADQELPSVYRYHGEPDEEKLAIFAQMAQAYGFNLNAEDITPKALNTFMTQLQGHPEERALNQLLLRSMMQAVYTSGDRGHYGLAAEYYLHFTSPIRRYPDLLVHRLLKAHWNRKGQKRLEAHLEREERALEDMAAQSSDRERAAMQAEREVVSYYAALMVKDRVGEEFAATVAGIAEFGFFVELDELHIEGLVRADTLGFGARFDKALLALMLPGGFRVRVGQKARVRLTSVNLTLRRIDFEALEVGGHTVKAMQAVERQEHEEQRRQTKEERKKAARIARERERQEKWGKPRVDTGSERSLAEAEEAQRRQAADAPETIEIPSGIIDAVAAAAPPEVPAEVVPVPSAGFERIRALAALDQPSEQQVPEKVKAVPPTRRKRAAAAAEEKPTRAKPPATRKQAAAKKPAAKKAAAAKKAPAKKPAAKKVTAKKAVAKKAPAKKPAAKKAAAAKKAPAKKAAAAKKAPAKKAAAAKKAPAKKAPAKKAAARKSTAASKARPTKGGAKKMAASRRGRKS